MFLHCLKCKKNTGSKNTDIERTKNKEMKLLSQSVIYNSKKSRFIKEQEVS